MTYLMNDVPGPLHGLAAAATSAGAPTGIESPHEPDRLVAIAATIAAELPAAAARLGMGRTVEAMSAAIGLGVAIDGAIAQQPGSRPAPEEVAHLAADLAGRVGLLLLDIAVEAVAVKAAGVAGHPPTERSRRAEQAVEALLDGIAAIRSQLGYGDTAERCAA